MIESNLRAMLARADSLLRQGDSGAARRELQAFGREDPSAVDVAEFHAILAQACLGDDAVSARSAIERAIALRPGWAQAHHVHALALRDLDLLDEAAASIDTALKLRPDDARAWASLGTIQHRRGLLAEAESAFRNAIAKMPALEVARRGLAEALQSAGIDDAAVAAWRQWMLLRGGSREARSRFGWALAQMHRWADAEYELGATVDLPDATAIDATRLSSVRRERGDWAGALTAFEQASRLAPELLTPWIGHSLLLPQVYEDVPDLQRWRARYVRGIDEVEARLPQRMLTPDALWQLDWSNFYLAYQGENDLTLQRRYATAMQALAGSAAAEWTAPVERPLRFGAKLKIGFASSFFRNCTVGSYFGPWITGLDRERFEIHVYYYGALSDQTTTAIENAAARFVRLPHEPRRIASTIRSADLDVLLYPQLGMDGLDSTLAALRLAPVQCVAWGHPETTGSDTIDWFLSCGDMEPVDGQRHYSERLSCLPGLGTRYSRPEMPGMSRAQFGLPKAERLYVCPHSLFKIHPDNDSMFADLLLRDPGARLVLCADPAQPVTAQFQRRLGAALRQHGVDAGRRVIIQPLRAPPDFRAMLSVCDVMLDTLHWSGGNTSLDALAAGLPIVTCPGAMMRGRQSAAMLRALGLPELIAESPADAVAKAIGVANETGVEIRSRIVRDRDALFNREEPLRALEEFLLRVCDRTS